MNIYNFSVNNATCYDLIPCSLSNTLNIFWYSMYFAFSSNICPDQYSLLINELN